MKLKVTYQRGGGSLVDLLATLDSQATVGDLADFLVQADPEPRPLPPGPHTVCIVDRGSRLLDRELPITDSPLQSGSQVSILPASTHYQQVDDAGAAAVLRVEHGPGARQEYFLRAGSSVVGRAAGCDVKLPDPMVSRRHVRVNVSDIIEVHDLGSANGTVIGDQGVARAALRPSDHVEIGDTRFSVRLLHSPHPQASLDHGTSESFVRSPLITPQFGGAKREAPQAPERPRLQRMPVVMLFVPILMAGVLYAATRNILSLLFIAMSPLMLVGNWFEQRRSARLDFAESVRLFDVDLEQMSLDLDLLADQEVKVRDQENPPSAQLLDAAQRRGPLLWSRRPDRDDFLALRLGVGALPSRTVVEVPKAGRAPYELWVKSQELAQRHSLVGPVPVVGNLRDSALGVAGPRRWALPSAKSLVAQAVALHSPAELVVAAFFSAETAVDWDWLKWLPHTTSPQSPVAGRHLVSTPPAGVELVNALEELLERRDDDYVASAADPAVLVLVEVDPPVEHNRLVHLAERGPKRGVHVLWLATDWTMLPSACTTYVSVPPTDAAASVGMVTDRVEVMPVQLDILHSHGPDQLGRSLAPVVDLGARVLDASDIPRTVSQLTMLGNELVDDVGAVIERWQESASILTGPCAPLELPKRAGTLRAVIGQSASGPHTIDLRTDGPHALVGGTTGAGKSELLQSWVLAMAAAHSPQRINFLFVDYKGGAAFADCEHLPHSIGVVTDLRPHLVRRSLTSLKAELHYRESLLAQHKAKDLVQMERRGIAEAPPSLIIVVDEFAALVNEVPEFVDGMVDVAQRGRSLGLHLILATQRPAGVIRDNLRANTNLRIALRMADADDSTDVLGTTAAAFFDPELPGRAMSKSGPKNMVPFQASYSGGWTAADQDGPEVVVEELTLQDPRSWRLPDRNVEVVRDEALTDMRRLVVHIIAAAQRAGLPDPRKAWQPELPTVLDLEGIDLNFSDDALALGRADEPQHQEQPTVFFHPDREGHLVVYGTSGSGKSTVLRTIAIAAGYAAVETPAHVYGLDFGSRGLSTLEVLPHVGSIIPGSDHERVIRLLATLRALIDERTVRFSAARATTLSEYRRRTGNREPRVLLLLDGLTAFRAAYETGDRQKWADLLVTILADGRPVGVHVVLSSDQRSGMTTAMASSVQRRLVLRMAAPDDYSLLGVPADVLEASSPPGRGLDGNTEVQVAILGRSTDVLAQSERMMAFGLKMRQAGVSGPPAVEALPDLITLASLPHVDGRVAIGVSGETLECYSLVPAGGFLLSGPSSSGRTTALQTIIASACRSEPRLRWHYLGQRRSQIAELRVWETRCTSVEETVTWADGVSAQIKRYSETGERAGIVIEGAGDYANSLAESAIQGLVRAAIADGHWVIAEGETSTLVTGIGFLGLVKISRTGLVLQPDQEMGGLYKTPFPRIQRSDFPVGRGFHVLSGRTSVVQVAVPWEVAD